MKIPRERIRVFISSAQKEEKGFDWEEVRQRIKKYLQKCPYLNPYIIEEEPSEIPSNQLFEFQVRKSDIVILLIKGEVRKGTASEFAISKKANKPMLIYFYKEDNPDVEVAIIKREIEQNNYCTYCNIIDSFDNIESKIKQDIIENIIQFYQYQHNNYSNSEDISEIILPNAESESTKLSTPTKTALSYFSSCYKDIYDYLDISELLDENNPTTLSIFHQLGTNLLEWLITGKPFYNAESISRLIEKVSEIFPDIQWLNKRWDAIKNRMTGDLDAALSSERAALSIAQEANLPGWIVSDILIDSRNFEFEMINQKGQLAIITESQLQIDKIETIVYLPVVDRYLEQVYEGITSEEINIWTNPHNTIRFGTNIGGIIINIENYLFSAMLYGSYTHMNLSREVLARTLYKYGCFTDNHESLFAAIKLYLLGGNTQDFIKIITHEWDKIYSDVTANADSLWLLAQNVDPIRRDSAKQAVIKNLGLYFSDKVFVSAEKYLTDFTDDVRPQNSEEFLECIGRITQRLNPLNLVIMLIGILKDKRFRLGDKLSEILLYLDVTNIPENIQQGLCDALVEQLPFLMEYNGTPQFISNLERQNPVIFAVLATTPGNHLQGIDKQIYDIQMKRGSWISLLEIEIDEVETQYKSNNNPNSYILFQRMPFNPIIQIIEDHFSSDMEVIITSRLFPLCSEILRSQAPLPVKDECIMCLCNVLAIYKNNNFFIPEELKEVIASLDITQNMGSFFLTLISIDAITYRLLMLKIIIDIVDKDELMQWFISMGKLGDNDRNILADCIAIYLRYCIDLDTVTRTMILSIVFQYCEDKFYQIRKKACDCLAYMLQTSFHDRIEAKLYEIAIDPSPDVRNYLLVLCKRGEITDVDVSNRIIEIMKNDANYAIRKYAFS